MVQGQKDITQRAKSKKPLAYIFTRIWVIPFAWSVLRLIVAWIVARKTCKGIPAPLSTTPTKAATASQASKKDGVHPGQSKPKRLRVF
jgi:hypothetical protein